MARCPNCGNENPYDANFCTKCGTNLKRNVEPLMPEELLVIHHELLSLKEEANEARKSSLVSFVIGIALLLIADWLADYSETRIPSSIWIFFIILMFLAVIDGIRWYKKYREYLSQLEGLKIYAKQNKIEQFEKLKRK